MIYSGNSRPIECQYLEINVTTILSSVSEPKTT